MVNDKLVYPYIPNSVPKIKEQMKANIGIKDDMELYRDIPETLRYGERLNIPEAIRDEFSIRQHTMDILKKNITAEDYDCFLGASCARHYTPAVCDEIVGRGEFLTAYIGCGSGDLGKWQAIFEYQSQMAELLDVDFVGFPEYDGGLALSHAVRMSTRLTGRKKILLPASMSKENLAIMKNYVDGVHAPAAELVMVAYDRKSGHLNLSDLKDKLDATVAAVVIENPSFLGTLEPQAKAIGQLAKAAGAEFIVYTDPIALGVMEAPKNYGATITVGDIHSLGLHLGAGGCQGGFIGLPEDDRYLSNFKDLAVAICPTVAPEEYSFGMWNLEESSYGRRDEANEFTGTATNLWGIQAGVYLSLMGPQGMTEVGETIMKRSQYAAAALAKLPGLRLQFTSPFFKEFVINFDGTGKTVGQINKELLGKKIIGGLDLSANYPELGQSSLYCVTETNTKAAIGRLISALEDILRY